MTTIAPVNLNELLVDLLNNNPTWYDLISAMDQVFATNIDDPINQLENLRDLTPTTPDLTLQKTARMLGFDLSSDVLNFSTSSLTKIVTQLALYPDQNGTELFNKFIDLLLNAYTEVTYLYTQDYEFFYDHPYGALVTEGGLWYKTTHIELSISLLITNEILNNVKLGTNHTFYQRLMELFYNFAPIALVIERMFFLNTERATIGVAAKIVPNYVQYVVVS